MKWFGVRCSCWCWSCSTNTLLPMLLLLPAFSSSIDIDSSKVTMTSSPICILLIIFQMQGFIIRDFSSLSFLFRDKFWIRFSGCNLLHNLQLIIRFAIDFTAFINRMTNTSTMFTKLWYIFIININKENTQHFLSAKIRNATH